MNNRQSEASKSSIRLSSRQKLVLAAYAATSFPADVALVLGCTVDDVETDLIAIRWMYQQAGQSTRLRPALIRSACVLGHLPDTTETTSQ